jgi:rhodanese-related sulfurtransferase
MTSVKTAHSLAIDAASLRQLIQQDAVILIDVREPLEYAGERIAQAKPMPLSRFEPQQLPWQADTTLVLYCQSGNRSLEALQQLQRLGFQAALHLHGGLQAWKQNGFPTLKSKNAPISIMRQVQIIAGTLILTGTLLGAFVSPYFLLLSGFVGAGLTFAGLSGTCMMANLLAKLPYNQVK